MYKWCKSDSEQSAGSSVWVELWPPWYLMAFRFCTVTHLQEKKTRFSDEYPWWTYIFDKKWLILSNLNPFILIFFSILFDKIGSVHKHLFNWAGNGTSHFFFYKTSFVLAYWLFKFVYLVDNVFKMNLVSFICTSRKTTGSTCCQE